MGKAQVMVEVKEVEEMVKEEVVSAMVEVEKVEEVMVAAVMV